MALTTYTQEQLSALKAQAAKGVRSVSYDGHLVQFASIEEMMKLIATIERELAGDGGAARRVSYGNDRGFR
jgi:hypothetical protein